MRIVFAWGTELVSRTISALTWNPWRTPAWGPSHVALLLPTTPEVFHLTGHDHLWVESSILLQRSCLVAGKPVCGLQAYDIASRFKDYPAGSVHVYSLTEPLSSNEEMLVSKVVFENWFQQCYPTRKSLRKRILFGKGDVPLCCEFVQDVMLMVNRGDWDYKHAHYSPAAFLRHHLKTGTIHPESC